MKSSTTAPGWKKQALFLFFGFLFACVILEIGLRMVNAMQERRAREEARATASAAGEYWAIYDPDLGYRMNPKYGDLNPDGLRDRPVGPKQGCFRLLFLGDSIGFYGDNLDDTMVGHLRTELHKNPAYDRVDVVNACIKGYTNYQEVGYLKKYGVKYEPDLVGIEFCLNDIPKFLMAFHFDENGKIMPGSYSLSGDALSHARSWPRRLMSHSALLVWLRDHIGLVSNLASWQAKRGFSFDFRTDINTAWKEDGWPDIEKQLAEAAALGREKGFRVFLTVFPVATQYQQDYLARDRNHVLMPQRKLKEICARLGIPFYDLYPDLAPDLIGPDAIHLTKEGRVRAGQAIAKFLEREKLLPAGAPATSERAFR